METLRLSGIALETLEKTRLCLQKRDMHLADKVISEDDVMDKGRASVIEKCIEIIAKQAPVAIDLRKIMVMMWFSQHLERMGDLCVNICRIAKHMKDTIVPEWMMDALDKMAVIAGEILVMTIEGFKSSDAGLIEKIEPRDDEIDNMHRNLFLSVSETSCSDHESLIGVLMVSRFIERFADHCVDTAEDIFYMVTGNFESK